ncbi:MULTISPECIES: hypothetical protein [unclassified Bosea (in: a-proteobacteria)]|uniref:hypothetical protein n=1 Tax=unclassified Bosea (in: a-proteobacteria) TaxID=2653178 RepID=UPI000F75AC7A|nr:MULTISPECIES: hypothetical protein [unclassified Bosea (in: a-proteobacteria)]AZO80736.1 hypothetical protein BLM15_26590 [Bosea sp. Tri-49]RXT25699.1 hypothetical protein B5U98_03750 [Bosea sp. Tri-39]RXT30941.1 hypothetical protein B5U99_19295 [Bosea sp. Tri-54]
MARKKSKPLDAAYVLFDVFYEDGSRSSNRRVPTELLGGIDGDDPALEAIQEQDRIIAEKSGRRPLAITSLVRAGESEKQAARQAEKASRRSG